MATSSPSPSASSTILPFLGARARRGSLASLSSTKGEVDKDVLAQALDSIHTSASKSETLTSFHDYDGGAPRNGAKDIVSSGLSGLYDKYIRGSSATSPAKDGRRPRSSQSNHSADLASLRLSGSRNASGLAKEVPTADVASIKSGTSATSSPRPKHINGGQNAQSEAKSNGAGREAPQSNVESTDRQPHRSIDTGGAAQKEAPQNKDKRDIEPPLTGPNPKKSKVVVSDSERRTAAEALARVLSQHEAPNANEQVGMTAVENDASTNDRSDGSRAEKGPPIATAAPAKNDRIHFEDDGPTRSTNLLSPDAVRPPMTKTGVSHLPGYAPSRASSTDGGDAASRDSSRAGSRMRLEPAPNLNTALQRRREGVHPHPVGNHPSNRVPLHLKRRVISKAFWMKDENAKDCFYCGQAFSTFRRKHHCRTCGQIFDAQCTNLVPGRPFGQPGTIRLCKPCEAMIYGSDDDSSVFSDDGSENQRTPIARRMTAESDDLPSTLNGMDDEDGDIAEVTTPSIGIPASRRNREAKRRSAVIEFDAVPALVRPTSSHSLISLARRPRSSSHRRQHSRHMNIRSLKGPLDERVPFQPGSIGDTTKDAPLNAFHNDAIIDPDLAAFASDDGSDNEDQPSIMSALNGEVSGSPREGNPRGLGSFAALARKGRNRQGLDSSTKMTNTHEASFQATRHLPKMSRNRNASFSGIVYGRPSPQRSRSNILLKQAVETDPFEHGNDAHSASANGRGTRFVRSSSMRGNGAPPLELNRASVEHLGKLLNQMLEDNKVESRHAWEKALIPILLRCTDDVEPNVQVGDDMDIRHYIKLKKIPGGRPGDTSYISGIVFSKNIALKSMARSLHQPRIAIVTFAIEYARHHTHFMSLEPVIAQEQEYLRNLVGRIATLKPDILLVQRNVSGSALDLLEKAGITVAYNIKESVLAAVARVTQTTMIKSVDKLAMDPSHLGQCQSFEIKTYVHEGIRKSYVYLSGCQPDLGCTVILRGSDTKTLRKIKRITEFMCYVAYNLKLETNLMRDEFVSIPSDIPQQTLSSAGAASKTVSRYESLERETRSRILSVSPFVVFMEPPLLTQLRKTENSLAHYKTLRDQYADIDKDDEWDEKEGYTRFEIVQPEMVTLHPSKAQSKALRDYLHAVHEAQFERTSHTYENQKRLMDSFMSVDANPLDPLSHQTIVVLQSTVSTSNSAPCAGPEVLAIGFYAGSNRVEPNFEEDCTLGQYVEDQCLSASNPCKQCGKRMLDHHRQYVHGHGQLSISVQRQAAKMRGFHKTILMWSTCRICKAETTVIPMSDNTWKYSFGKYLELGFWSSVLHPRAGVCQHDIHKDFLRCFGFEELVVCVQYDPIDIYDVVVPRSTVMWKVEADLKVKNAQYSRFVARLNAFTESIKKRLDSINVDPLDEKKSTEAHDVLLKMRQRAKDDHEELLRKLQRKYAESRYYELIPLNRALRFMEEKAIEWDETFSDFERDYFPSETDIRKLATLQLRNMFLESQPASSIALTGSSDTSEDEESPVKSASSPHILTRTATAPVMHSAKAHNVLSSTVEEHKNQMVAIGDVPATIGSGMVETSDDSLVRKMSPREEQEQAVQREDVKHLDLAVAIKAYDESIERSSSQELTTEPVRPNTANSSSIEKPFATQSKPVASGLMERIEQIRNTRNLGGGDGEITESRIPRLTTLTKRDASPTPAAPALTRALSSPSSPRHDRESELDVTFDQSIDAIASSNNAQQEPRMEKHFAERLGVARLASKVGKIAPSLIPRSIPMHFVDENHSTRVSALAKHFEQMSREFEKERLKERRQRALRSRQARANPLASSRPVVEVYRNATEAVGGHHAADSKAAADGQEKEGITETLNEGLLPITRLLNSDEPPEEPFAPELDPVDANSSHVTNEADSEPESTGSDMDDTLVNRATEASTHVPSPTASGLASPSSANDLELVPEITIPEHKKNVWLKYLAEFWSKRTASGWTSLEYPLRATEHVFEDSDIIVREDEPSSVIALSLACNDYQIKVQGFRNQPKRHAKQASQSSSYVGEPIQDGAQKAIEASLLSDTGTHMKYSFAHGSVKASCKIFYAEAFDALRRKCGISDRFVESLSRCVKFDTKGGKTKSIFLKTHDNRFYIKSMQEVELKAFTKFAPDYFAFMSHTLFHGVPSVIAKMLGVFQVTIKNPATGVDFSYYLLVMENLFYERAPNRRFDLKGSMRNRKIESTGQPDEVLLDENLVETIFESPLFVREHARRLLQASVWNDTMWLCKQNVMDYSLMAGFDDQSKELVVGIIDCIRTYTWDKKLESWIKDRGKNKPTITSPKDYRNRFRVSMMQYVLQAPSPWSRFAGEMELGGRLPQARGQQEPEQQAGSSEKRELIQP